MKIQRQFRTLTITLSILAAAAIFLVAVQAINPKVIVPVTGPVEIAAGNSIEENTPLDTTLYQLNPARLAALSESAMNVPGNSVEENTPLDYSLYQLNP